MNKNITKSDSILKKRIRRFKSIKRGYYSFILLVTLYLLSFFAPILVNSKALLVCYSNNQYDQGEKFIDKIIILFGMIKNFLEIVGLMIYAQVI